MSPPPLFPLRRPPPTAIAASIRCSPKAPRARSSAPRRPQRPPDLPPGPAPADHRVTVMTSQEMLLSLERLLIERDQARMTGFRDNDCFMDALEDDLASARDAYVGIAVTEIATLRGQLTGRQVG